MTKQELKDAVLVAVKKHGGRASLVDIAKFIWVHHETDLRAAGDQFYRWQYEMRWAANELRHEGKLADVASSPRGIWILA
jgi:hypothetical protein